MKKIHVKIPPLRLVSHYQDMMDARKITRPPVWFRALKAFPPSSEHISKGVIPSQVGQFRKATDSHASDGISVDRPGKVTMEAPEIVYPEDEIRKQFYKDHPFELDRPRILLENEEQLGNIVWTDIFGGSALQPLSGESVVQRTLYLMAREGGSLPRHLAYAQALNEFYRARKAEELAERQNRMKLKVDDTAKYQDSGFIIPALQNAKMDLPPKYLFPGSPFARLFHEKQKLYAEKKRLIGQELLDVQRKARVDRERLSAFDLKNRSKMEDDSLEVDPDLLAEESQVDLTKAVAA